MSLRINLEKMSGTLGHGGLTALGAGVVRWVGRVTHSYRAARDVRCKIWRKVGIRGLNPPPPPKFVISLWKWHLPVSSGTLFSKNSNTYSVVNKWTNSVETTALQQNDLSFWCCSTIIFSFLHQHFQCPVNYSWANKLCCFVSHLG